MLGVFAAARDVTLRKQAESAVETLLSLQGAVVESTADGIVGPLTWMILVNSSLGDLAPSTPSMYAKQES